MLREGRRRRFLQQGTDHDTYDNGRGQGQRIWLARIHTRRCVARIPVPITVFSDCYKDSPIEVIVGTIFLYNLLGSSAFVGLAVTCLFLPLNHFAGKIVVGAQENLMKARDERVALMNEILGAIRMLKVLVFSSTTWFSTLILPVHGMGAQL